MKSTSAGFTRIELAAVVAAIVILLTLAVPLLASSRTASTRVACFNNLRQLGTAVLLFSNNHDDRPPWLTPVGQGGTFPVTFGKIATPWTEFIVLTNELASPAILACPSDAKSKVASHWGNTANGLANSGFRANAVSYFLSFHGQTELGRSVVTGDRDLRPSFVGPSQCSRGAVNVSGFSRNDFSIAWTNDVHYDAGHLLFMDGTVDYVNNERLRLFLIGAETQNDSGNIHFVNTR